MNMKKALPIIFFVILAIVAILIKRCNERKIETKAGTTSVNRRDRIEERKPPASNGKEASFNRSQELFFTKHAKCRMACRKITQKEVREILYEGKINYNKSDLNDKQGGTYAVEGLTSDRQRVRIIFAPKQKHMSVVTVIDLENEYACPSC